MPQSAGTTCRAVAPMTQLVPIGDRVKPVLEQLAPNYQHPESTFWVAHWNRPSRDSKS